MHGIDLTVLVALLDRLVKLAEESSPDDLPHVDRAVASVVGRALSAQAMLRARVRWQRQASRLATTQSYKSISEEAKRVGLCASTLEDAVRKGEIQHIRKGRRILLPPTAVDEWLRRDEHGPRHQTTRQARKDIR